MAEPISSDMAGQHRSAPASSESAHPALPLSEGEFAEAVRAALRHYLRTDLLRDSPLLGSHLVAEALRAAEAPAAPVQVLRDLLREHCERIGDAPKLAALRRVLELTWLTPMRSQQVVAESLHLSWSTYRRRLADAVQLLVAQLWEAECALAGPAETDERAAGRAEDVTTTGSASGESEPPPRSEPPTDAAPVKSRRRRRYAAAAGALVLAAIIIVAVLFRTHRSAAPATRAAAAAPPASQPATSTVTLAVLPFLDMDANPDQRYLSDGITEELINRLGR